MCLLQDFCCCCSLSTGVLFISIINLLLSFFPYLYGNDSEFVAASAVRFDDHNIHELSCLYYGITATVSVGALFSVLSSNRWLLVPLQLWDVFRLIVILEIVIRTFGRGPANATIWIVAVLLLYCISVEYSYRRELLEGHPHDGMILAPGTTVTVCTTAPTAPPNLSTEHHQFAPASTVVALPDEYNVQSPYAKSYPAYQPQPPYPLSAPAAPVYPPQPYAAGASAPPAALPYPVGAQPPFSPGAPPPYPVVQSQVSHENPPPYAP